MASRFKPREDQEREARAAEVARVAPGRGSVSGGLPGAASTQRPAGPPIAEPERRVDALAATEHGARDALALAPDLDGQAQAGEPVATRQTLSSGGFVTRDPAGRAQDWKGPVITNQLTPANVLANAEGWAQFRLDSGLNTIGPDGAESGLLWRMLGSVASWLLSEHMQEIAAVHDVHGAEAARQIIAGKAPGTPAYDQAVVDWKAANARSGLAVAMALMEHRSTDRDRAAKGLAPLGPAAAIEASRQSWATSGFKVSPRSEIAVTVKPPGQDKAQR